MKNYKKVFSALASKGVIDVYMQIYYGCKTEEYQSFENIRKELRMSKDTLRKLTNRLSRCGLISSAQPYETDDKRKRVYVVDNPELAELVNQIYNL